jgi:hypothetical protein
MASLADKKKALDWSNRNTQGLQGILDVNQFLPVTGDVQSGIMAGQDLQKGNYGSAALNSLGLLPFIPALGGVIAKNIPSKTTFESAQETAQRNASLPVSEGGLGLPASNTAMDRAKAMGYTNPAYHGTNADFGIFNVEGKGKTSGGGAFVTDNPVVAETYVGGAGSGGSIMPLLVRKDNLLDVNARGRNWADIWTDQLSAKSKGKKYSLDDLGLDRYSATTTDELAQIAPELGLKGASIKNVRDLGPSSHIFRGKEYLLNKYGIVPDETWSNVTGKQFDEARKYMDKFYKSQKSNITALQDPSDIRSINAAFDPFRRKEADILAGVAAAPVGLLAIEEEKTKKKRSNK